MEMRIIGGAYRGTKITIPDQFATFRPTKNMVREAVVSSILSDVHGAQVLELCAGSSIMSLELLSRGALSATAVDKDSALYRQLPQYIKNSELRAKISHVNSSVDQYLNSCRSWFDIIFFDPPYYENSLTDLLPQVLTLLVPSGVLLFETATDDTYATKIIASLNGVTIKEKAYGKSYIRTIRKGV